MKFTWTSLLLMLLVVASCTNDPYDSGDSRYSYLRADFVEATTDGNGRVVSALTDDGVSLTFTQSFAVSWISEPDTSYRALLYYYISDSTADGQRMSVEPLTAGQVYVLKAQTRSEQQAIVTDPVHFQSSWTSRNGSYANFRLALMTGVADNVDAKQALGLVCDSVKENRNGHHTYYYKLLHDQGGAPQYYKATVFVSIPTQKMTTGDVVQLSLNTYDGWKTRTFSF